MEARRFWAEQIRGHEAELRELEGFADVMRKLLQGLPTEMRLSIVFTPEERLAGLSHDEILSLIPLKERLAGLAPEQAILALPDEVLRSLPEECVATLSEATRTAIHNRIER